MEQITISIPKLEYLQKFPAKLNEPLKLRNCYSVVNRNDLPTKAGVYFLLDADDIIYRVMYIGQTANIRGRIVGHLGNNRKFTKVAFVLEDNVLIRQAMEFIYINKYKPFCNNYNETYGNI